MRRVMWTLFLMQTIAIVPNMADVQTTNYNLRWMFKLRRSYYKLLLANATYPIVKCVVITKHSRRTEQNKIE